MDVMQVLLQALRTALNNEDAEPRRFTSVGNDQLHQLSPSIFLEGFQVSSVPVTTEPETEEMNPLKKIFSNDKKSRCRINQMQEHLTNIEMKIQKLERYVPPPSVFHQNLIIAAVAEDEELDHSASLKERRASRLKKLSKEKEKRRKSSENGGVLSKLMFWKSKSNNSKASSAKPKENKCCGFKRKSCGGDHGICDRRERGRPEKKDNRLCDKCFRFARSKDVSKMKRRESLKTGTTKKNPKAEKKSVQHETGKKKISDERKKEQVTGLHSNENDDSKKNKCEEEAKQVDALHVGNGSEPTKEEVTAQPTAQEPEKEEPKKEEPKTEEPKKEEPKKEEPKKEEPKKEEPKNETKNEDEDDEGEYDEDDEYYDGEELHHLAVIKQKKKRAAWAGLPAIYVLSRENSGLRNTGKRRIRRVKKRHIVSQPQMSDAQIQINCVEDEKLDKESTQLEKKLEDDSDSKKYKLFAPVDFPSRQQLDDKDLVSHEIVRVFSSIHGPIKVDQKITVTGSTITVTHGKECECHLCSTLKGFNSPADIIKAPKIVRIENSSGCRTFVSHLDGCSCDLCSILDRNFNDEFATSGHKEANCSSIEFEKSSQSSMESQIKNSSEEQGNASMSYISEVFKHSSDGHEDVDKYYDDGLEDGEDYYERREREDEVDESVKSEDEIKIRRKSNKKSKKKRKKKCHCTTCRQRRRIVRLKKKMESPHSSVMEQKQMSRHTQDELSLGKCSSCFDRHENDYEEQKEIDKMAYSVDKGERKRKSKKKKNRKSRIVEVNESRGKRDSAECSSCEANSISSGMECDWMRAESEEEQEDKACFLYSNSKYSEQVKYSSSELFPRFNSKSHGRVMGNVRSGFEEEPRYIRVEPQAYSYRSSSPPLEQISGHSGPINPFADLRDRLRGKPMSNDRNESREDIDDGEPSGEMHKSSVRCVPSNSKFIRSQNPFEELRNIGIRRANSAPREHHEGGLAKKIVEWTRRGQSHTANLNELNYFERDDFRYDFPVWPDHIESRRKTSETSFYHPPEKARSKQIWFSMKPHHNNI